MLRRRRKDDPIMQSVDKMMLSVWGKTSTNSTCKYIRSDNNIKLRR